MSLKIYMNTTLYSPTPTLLAGWLELQLSVQALMWKSMVMMQRNKTGEPLVFVPYGCLTIPNFLCLHLLHIRENTVVLGGSLIQVTSQWSIKSQLMKTPKAFGELKDQCCCFVLLTHVWKWTQDLSHAWPVLLLLTHIFSPSESLLWRPHSHRWRSKSWEACHHTLHITENTGCHNEHLNPLTGQRTS